MANGTIETLTYLVRHWTWLMVQWYNENGKNRWIWPRKSGARSFHDRNTKNSDLKRNLMWKGKCMVWTEKNTHTHTQCTTFITTFTLADLNIAMLSDPRYHRPHTGSNWTKWKFQFPIKQRNLTISLHSFFFCYFTLLHGNAYTQFQF